MNKDTEAQDPIAAATTAFQLFLTPSAKHRANVNAVEQNEAKTSSLCQMIKNMASEA
jgi:hypothetical protein